MSQANLADSADRVHDLGGRRGFGPIPIAGSDAPFAERWEAHAFAVTQFAQGLSGFTTDAFRHGIEREDPHDYLRLSYWAKWTRNAERMLVEGGVVAPDAVTARLSGTAVRTVPERTTDATPPTQRTSLADPATEPRFVVGRRVRVGRPRTDGGHTRLPAYVAGRVGEIVANQGGWVYPDTYAHGLGPSPQWVYTVAFVAEDLWPDSGTHRVHVDLFEPYLETP